MRCELIVSTYNAPGALRLTLLSVLGQRRRPDSVAVADDGSGPETAKFLVQFQKDTPDLPLRHVWHEDQGFRKTAILNRAIATSEADVLIFTDGDCLLAPNFIARHLATLARNRFCSGSLIRLSAAATATVTDDLVSRGTVWSRPWLKSVGAFDRTTTWLKSMPFPPHLQSALEAAYPIRRTWMGSSASAHRAAILGVNGFDETMAWGGEDKEFGIRLANSGVKGRSLRFTTPVVHLDHPRGYRDAEAIARQRAMIETARKTGKTWTEDGLQKG